jgi:hypothetical protein
MHLGKTNSILEKKKMPIKCANTLVKENFRQLNADAIKFRWSKSC